MYQGQQCHRGHLYPAMTASGNPANAANSVRSTYQYTNAVPQCAPFNTGLWSNFEGRIRNYAVQTCIPGNGELFLVTGSSFTAFQNTPPQPVPAPITQLVNGGIDRPNLLWTAGTCLYPGGQCDSFAVIGNNVPASLTQEITQAQLNVILQFDVQSNGLKRDKTRGEVKLFPGAARSCSNVQLPSEEYPPTGKSGKDKKHP